MHDNTVALAVTICMKHPTLLGYAYYGGNLVLVEDDFEIPDYLVPLHEELPRWAKSCPSKKLRRDINEAFVFMSKLTYVRIYTAISTTMQLDSINGMVSCTRLNSIPFSTGRSS